MKMSLSVVMGILDKTTAPLKQMSEETNVYAKSIKRAQEKQKDQSAALGMIDSFRKTREVMDKNSLAIATASEKLEELESKAASAQKPSAALTERITKQREKLLALNDAQDESKDRLIKLGKQLKKTGVKMHDLDGSSDKLNQSYKKHGKEIKILSKKYAHLQTAMKLPRGLNKALKMPTMEGAKNGALAVTGVLGSMAGFGVIINDTANELDELRRAAEHIELPVSELQAMRLQATQAGAEAEDMDAAIKEMALRWGEMKTFKSGAMNDFFKDTGNQKAYEDLMKAKDASEAYQVLLREIANETDVSKQNFMADEFFGGDSEKILEMLKGGAEGYEKAKQLLNDTGGAVDPESTQNAQAFSASMGKLGAIVNSLKISALTPIMGELSSLMEELAINMKSMDWREEKIAELRDIVKGTFNAFRTLGGGVLWVGENMSTVIGALLGVKLALIGINAVALANPLGPFIIAIGAIIAGVGLLIDHFGGLTKIMDNVKSFWNSIWGDDEESDKTKQQAKVSKQLQNRNAASEVTYSQTRSEGYERYKRRGKSYNSDVDSGYQAITQSGQSNAYQPIKNQTMNSKSEVELRIKSDKPVTVDKAKSEKGTDLNLDVGNMSMSY